MTFKERLEIEHPEYANEAYVGGCFDCPHSFGYEKREDSLKNCYSKGGKGCVYCWNREIPVDEFKPGDKVRIKKDSPKNGWNMYGKMDHWMGKVMTIMSIDGYYFTMKEDQCENNGSGWTWVAEDFERVKEGENDMKKDFAISDMKDGMLIEHRDGERMLWLNKTGRGINRFSFGYTDELNGLFGNPNLDIMKVGYPSKEAVTIKDMIEYGFSEIVWERKEEPVTKDVSLEELNAILKEKFPDVDKFNLPLEE